jgi:hypothetical protein
VKQAVLDGPGAKTVNLDTLGDSYRAILMPSKRPVRRRRLIEQNSPHRPARTPQNRRCNHAHGSGCRQEGTQRGDAMNPDTGLRGRQVVEGVPDALQIIRIQGGRKALGPVAVERQCRSC